MTGRFRWRITLPVLASGLLLSTAVPAQDSAATDSAGRGVVSPASPRWALDQFFALTRSGDFRAAARYLDVPPSRAAEGPELARQLKAVLDRHLWVDLERVSPLAAGDRNDDLPATMEQIGFIGAPGAGGRPVRLLRYAGGDPPWRFSLATVELIPGWYQALEGRWLMEHLPPALLRPGPLELLLWQWLALPLIAIIGLIVGKAVGRVLQWLAMRLSVRTSLTWDDVIVSKVSGPLSAALALATVAALLPWLGLYAPAAAAAYRVVQAGYFIVFFWTLFRLVDVGFHVLGSTPWARGSATSRSLLPLGSRLAKIGVFAIATVAVLSFLGYPVASLVAGLGIGGLAVALAAQKTVENLFGTFSLGVDQPFRVGDFVKVDDFVATVETVGLRSTRFRTLDRTLVTIPNGRLADSRLESFTARDRLRLHAIIGLGRGTTEAQMRAVLAGFEEVLRRHPKIWPDAVVVRFREIGASSLDIEVMCWFETSDFSQFQLIRQEVLLHFMGVVERAGTSFAFPTRTVHLAGDGARAAADPR